LICSEIGTLCNGRQEQRHFLLQNFWSSRRRHRPSAAEILGFPGSLTALARIFAADSLQMQQTELAGLNCQLPASTNAKSWLQDRGGTLAASGWL
jgi:hypothetical protein